MKTFSKTKNGLRFHYPSKKWYINAKRPGSKTPTSLCTGTNIEAEAKAFFANWLAKVHAPGAAEQAAKLKAGLTLARYIEHYRRLVSLEQNADDTRDHKLREIGYIETHWAAFRNRPLADEDPRTWSVLDLLEFQKALSGYYVPGVANRHCRVLTLILELVEDDINGFRSPHRHRHFEPVSVPSRGKVGLPSEEQFRAVLAALRADPDNWHREDSADLAEGLAYSNLRIDEANRLRIEHVNLTDGCLDLPPEIVKGKRNGRKVPLGPAALALFTRLVNVAGPDKAVFKAKDCNAALARACAKVGCAKLSHHKLRHWWATIALEKTGDAKQVSEWLGHRDGGKLVLATYTHTRKERETLLAAKLTFDWSAPKVVNE